ncbi:hypothetical protein BDM02DRAFT_3117461 [Thelephora ganbajun]|uniref:Uncharacterized protein n=1 Tax=Thelephora ganbajun TaxID=370292 RepID=A0ACB6ZCT5_THEGA|nr:hypothetical protein BDM02DRAFT_3117461 [Thelephora ganbajun]
MHHIFEVDEIVRFIASSIAYGNPKGAVSFACCCRSLSAPVLDTIWGDYQEDFTRLLQTLPPSAWTIVDEAFDFVRQPSEEEWARLSIYAERMRHFMEPRDAAPSEVALRLLNTRFSGRCMLPNLQDIGWINASPEHLELILPLIVSPVLTNFRLGVSIGRFFDVPQVVLALEALAPAYNSLVEIRIYNSMIHDPRIIDATSTLLLRCNPNKLRYFRVGSCLSTEAFIHATQLPHLEAFAMRTDTTGLGVPLPTSMFPSLKLLEINATNPRSPLLKTIAHIQSKTLDRLDLISPAATLGTFLPATLAALRPRGLYQTLTALSIFPKGGLELDMAIIRPLLCLNQLTHLEIMLICSRNSCPYGLSDEDLEELVKAMPKLRLLSLGSVPCSRPVNNTIKSLVAIAKHCKHLDRLVIHTNVEAIVNGAFQRGGWGEDPTVENCPSALVGCPLRNIVFGPCFIPNEEQGATIFALMLLRLFPYLRSLAVFFLTREADPLWELVNDVITTHKRVGTNVASAAADMGVN